MSSRYRLAFSTLTLVITILHLTEAASGPGSTHHIRNIFIGRCNEYDALKYKDVLPRVNVDCHGLWTKFLCAFGYRPPCSTNINDYTQFFDAVQQEIPMNKSMFYSSAIFDLVHAYGKFGRRYVTLEDTMSGYILNDLTWCGKKWFPGIDYKTCPEWGSCPDGDGARESFWGAASANYAKSARGEVTYMTSGSNDRKKAFREHSFFANYELPSMSDKVNKLKALIIHDLGKPKLESCGTGSLVELEKRVRAKGYDYECVDDPGSVLHLLCSENENAQECQMGVLSTPRTRSN